MLEAYASAYDEIVQGYADGTRNVYVEDESVESGYRKMTAEEEISGLDAAYQKYVSGFERIPIPCRFGRGRVSFLYISLHKKVQMHKK